MAKKFNIAGVCFPEDHYMADVSAKITAIMKMVEEGDYFIINRPRQYGKTTTLNTLTHTLPQLGDYMVFDISFEGVGDEMFLTEAAFSEGFIELLVESAQYMAPHLVDWLNDSIPGVTNLQKLSKFITDFVVKANQKVVLMIDEVDKSSNNQLFISFLGVLRNKYLKRKSVKTFHSVILAGVHDVKSLKVKIRPDEEQKLNSPWNIAAEFKVDMNLQPAEIKSMLDEYVVDRGVQMDTGQMANSLFYYTSGYPFLVSKLCKMMDEEIMPLKKDNKWTQSDLDLTVRRLIKESNTNFETLGKNLDESKTLYDLVYKVAVDGEKIEFNQINTSMNFALLYGFFVERDNNISIHNRIYQEVILNYMTSQMFLNQLSKGHDLGSAYNHSDNSLNLEKVLLQFQVFMRSQYSKHDRDFLERHARLVFLAFLKPIINGSGYDFKEVQVSEERRLDVVITFNQYRYVAELKLWRGEAAHQKGLVQLTDYLDRLSLSEGYLIIFDHSEVKSWQNGWITFREKKIFAVWV